jgi:hypothetical protein
VDTKNTIIGVKPGVHAISGTIFSWPHYWTQQKINDNCLFFASHSTDLLSKVVATQLANQVTGATDYFTVTGTGLNARYRTPNTAPYKAADTDYVFWKTDASESTCDGNRLIGYDFPRILVKYLNVSPYTILWLAILKPGVTVTNGMRDAFDLSIWWSNTLSFHGVPKQNKPLFEQYVWTPESVYVLHDTFTDVDTTLLSAHTMDIGSGWTTSGGLYISNNQVVCPATQVAELNGIAESGESDCDVSCDLIIQDITLYYSGLVFRYQDATHKFWAVVDRDTGVPRIDVQCDGVNLQSFNLTHSPGTHNLKIGLSGSIITIYWDNVAQGSPITNATYQTATKHGIRMFTGYGYVAPAIDNFIVR